MRIAVTGASGLVGRALVARLDQVAEIDACYLTRTHSTLKNFYTSPDLSQDLQDWIIALRGCDVVVHLAASLPWSRVSLSDMRKINVEGTSKVAEASRRVGVKRFVFLSTLGIHGVTSGDTPFSPASGIAPSGQYAQTKYEAECALSKFQRDRSMEIVTLRPPLVYGPEVGGKLGLLCSKIKQGNLIPICEVQNRRQMVSANNLASIIHKCCVEEQFNGVFLPADSEKVSTIDLMKMIAECHERPLRTLKVPAVAVRHLSKLPVIGGYAERLIGNVEVLDSRLSLDLAWHPPYRLQEEIRLIN